MNENFVAEQKEEAIKRMKLLDLHENIIREFEEDGRINISEKFGTLFWLDEEKEKLIRQYEKETNSLVYHVIHNYSNFGEMLNVLSVSKHKEDWEYETYKIKENVIYCYVINLDDDTCSEYGSIGIKKMFGGLIRTC